MSPEEKDGCFMHPAGERVLRVTRITYYGRVTIKPECELSQKFCNLLRQKTLTEENIRDIKALGFTVRTLEEEL